MAREHDPRELDDVALVALAEAAAAEPPPALRGRVLGAVAEAKRARAARSLRRWRVGTAVAAAAAIALAVVATLERGARDAALGERIALVEQIDTLEARLVEQNARLTSLRETLAVQAETLEILSGPRVLTASLAPAAGHGGQARVIVDPASGRVALAASDLAALDPDRIYELWAIRGDAAPEPAGLFATRDGGAVVRLDALARPEEVTAFAVSIEPTGGSAAPTGPIVLAGAVRS